MTRAALPTCLLWSALASAAVAQQAAAPGVPAVPPPTPKIGNPTPGTPQPAPPNVQDRIAVTGCLQLAPGAGAAPARAATTPADDRFVLTRAKKDGVVPP